jgi:hypothetical protein
MDYPEKVRRFWDSKHDSTGSLNLADAVGAFADEPKPLHGDTWGNWWYDQKNRVLEHRKERYYVILNECGNSARVLDWIAQIKLKTWATAKDLGDLVTALDDLIDLQGNLCGGGQDHKLDVKAWLDANDDGKYEGGFDEQDEEDE